MHKLRQLNPILVLGNVVVQASLVSESGSCSCCQTASVAFVAFLAAFVAFLALLGQVGQPFVVVPAYSVASVVSSSPSFLVVACPSLPVPS